MRLNIELVETNRNELNGLKFSDIYVEFIKLLFQSVKETGLNCI